MPVRRSRPDKTNEYQPTKVFKALMFSALAAGFLTCIFGFFIISDANQSKNQVEDNVETVEEIILALDKSYQLNQRYSKINFNLLAPINPAIREYIESDNVLIDKSLSEDQQNFYLSVTALDETEADPVKQNRFQIAAGKTVPTLTLCDQDIRFYGGVCIDGQWRPPPGNFRPVRSRAVFIESAAKTIENVYRKQFQAQKKYIKLTRRQLLSRAPDLKIYLEIIDFNVRVKPTHLRIGIKFEDPGGRIDFWKTLKRNKTQLEICIGSRDDYCQKADPFTD